MVAAVVHMVCMRVRMLVVSSSCSSCKLHRVCIWLLISSLAEVAIQRVVMVCQLLCPCCEWTVQRIWRVMMMMMMMHRLGDSLPIIMCRCDL